MVNKLLKSSRNQEMNSFEFPDLSRRIEESLEKAGISSLESILVSSEHELRKFANLTKEECKEVKCKARKKLLAARFVTADEVHEVARLSTGCPVVDKFLHGGIPLRGITEIAGESGLGKTQFCLQMSITVQFAIECGGLGAGAVYICTEDAFPSKRLQQLLHTFPSTYKRCTDGDCANINFGDSIFVEHIGDVEGLQRCLNIRLPLLLSQQNIGLIVLDSIAGIFRADYEPGDALNRAKDIRAVGGQLHKLSTSHHLVVLCVNQVTDAVGKEASQQCVAALGLAWANVVTTRLQLFRKGSEKHIRALFAPDLPSENICPYIITSAGVTGIL